MITNETRIKVMDKLHEIEKLEHVKVLYAVETASRAWGFASTNSEWDVRFVMALRYLKVAFLLRAI